jgi:cystathionine beta-synthase/cysteine synthase A
MVHDSVLDLIGSTPVVRLRRLVIDNGTEILVKIEAANPGRSIKDRAALSMVEQAEQAGRLHPGGTIVESTSGNLGKSLALIGAVKGYRIILIVDPKVPRSVIEFAVALGAEIDVVDTLDEQGGYQRSRVARVREMLTVDPTLFWPDQYENPANPRVHADRTAWEILGDVGEFDTLVAAVSTGGHITGLSRTLKAQLPALATVAVDACGSSVFGHPFHTYLMRGLGLAWQPGNLDVSLVDRVHLVADHEGMATCRVLARQEGLLIGESAGAAIFAALHHAHHHPGERIVVIAADDGANYLGESFDDTWLHARGVATRMADAGLGDPARLIEAARTPTHHAVPLATASAGTT